MGVRGGGTLCTVFNRPALIQRENIVENILEHLNILEMSFKDLLKLKQSFFFVFSKSSLTSQWSSGHHLSIHLRMLGSSVKSEMNH